MDKNNIAPEYLDLRQVGVLIGKPWNSLRRTKSEGKMPPHLELSARNHRWRRSDIVAWVELRGLGLFEENAWLSLRKRLGPTAAWKVMLARLEAEHAKTAAVVAREIAEQKT